MTQQQAMDTGLLVAGDATTPDPPGSCITVDLTGSTTDSSVGFVRISRAAGVNTIEVRQQLGLHTPQGVGIGSTSGQLMRAYPTWTSFIANVFEASVPENPNAAYRFTLDRPDEVTRLSLSLKATDCPTS